MQELPNARDPSHAKPAHFPSEWNATPLGETGQWPAPLRSWAQFILEAAQPMFLLWGTQRIFLFNHACKPFIGPAHELALGARIEQLWAPIWTEVGPHIEAAFAGRSGVIENHAFLTWASAFRETGYFTFCYAPIRDDEGAVTASFCTIAETTRTMRLELELRRERDTLRELFEQTPSFMAMLEGPEHRYILSNTANQKLLGDRDVIGKTVAEVLPELVQQGFAELLDKVYSTGEAFFGKGLPIEVRDAPGAEPRRRFVDFIYQPIRNSAGVVTGIFIEGHDVTEQHLAHERITVLQGELINSSRATSKGAMASTLAHELNQPLAAISNYVSAASRIAERAGTDPMLVECLLSAQEAALRAGDAIRALREMSESGRVHSEVLAVEVAISEAVQLARAAHPNLTVTVLAPPGAIAKVDRIHFQHVLLNLLRNSSEAARGSACQVDFEVTLEGEETILSITDNGTGIPEDALPKVFDAFFTTKARGMGVGLAICRTIIEANGGRISACNNETDGATITIVLRQE